MTTATVKPSIKKPKRRRAESVTVSGMPRNRIRSFDAASTGRINIAHFQRADGRDADAIIAADLATLRNRARYEIRNNSYAKGIVDTLGTDLIGCGPRLQVQTRSSDYANEVEDKFTEWMDACELTGRMVFSDCLRLAGAAQQAESGEAFVVLQTAMNTPALNRPGVSLKISVVEPDRVTTPMDMIAAELYGDKIRDGIEYDSLGRPAYYYIKKRHPGSRTAYGGLLDYDKVPAAQVIHLYRSDRPGQSRGVPWITPALPLFAQLRRYTLAVLDSAETAAKISAIMKSLGNEISSIEPMDELDIPRNSILTAPEGWDVTQLRAEQPTDTYEKFKHEIVNEMARCFAMPYNVAAANSSDYNYASGRLDWQSYYKFLTTVRNWINKHLLDSILYAWHREASLIPGYLRYQSGEPLRHVWYWPGFEHVDPAKEALAQERRLKNLTTTLADEYGREGKDWERQLEAVNKQFEKMKQLGWMSDDDIKQIILKKFGM